jgi:hypothetical protein
MKRLFANERPSSMYLAVFIALLFTPVVYWWMDDSLPRVVYTIRVENNPVIPGEALRLRFFGDSIRNCPAAVHETITDGKSIVSPIASRPGKLDVTRGTFGDGKGIPIDIPTPNTAAPGNGAYDSDVDYFCNPLQRIFPLRVHRHVDFIFALPPKQSSDLKPDRGVAFNYML